MYHDTEYRWHAVNRCFSSWNSFVHALLFANVFSSIKCLADPNSTRYTPHFSRRKIEDREVTILGRVDRLDKTFR